jgi:hypothetical protein
MSTLCRNGLGLLLCGFISSTVTTVLVYERIRDRSLLCEKKFDDSEIRSYTYKMVPLYFLIIFKSFDSTL